MLLPKSCTSANIAEPYWSCQLVVLSRALCQEHGCMYGVVEQCGQGRAIKKPWSFVSWNLGKPKDLELTCDGSHEHAPCAGRETREQPPACRVLHAWGSRHVSYLRAFAEQSACLHMLVVSANRQHCFRFILVLVRAVLCFPTVLN